MNKENKQLLFKELCMRLPYGVKVTWDGKHSLTVTHHIYCAIASEDKIDNLPKLLLRPMSSMTEEEKEEMHNLLSPTGTAIYKNDGIALPINHYGEYVTYEFMNRIIQYLLENHFDFMGLIPKGLAIEAPEGMYN